MKKATCIFLVLIMVVTLSSCASKTNLDKLRADENFQKYKRSYEERTIYTDEELEDMRANTDDGYYAESSELSKIELEYVQEIRRYAVKFLEQDEIIENFSPDLDQLKSVKFRLSQQLDGEGVVGHYSKKYNTVFLIDSVFQAYSEETQHMARQIIMHELTHAAIEYSSDMGIMHEAGINFLSWQMCGDKYCTSYMYGTFIAEQAYEKDGYSAIKQILDGEYKSEYYIELSFAALVLDYRVGYGSVDRGIAFKPLDVAVERLMDSAPYSDYHAAIIEIIS